ncbi:MAG: hypothetical protein AAF655_18435 [Bacteroidota bacterium]
MNKIIKFIAGKVKKLFGKGKKGKKDKSKDGLTAEDRKKHKTYVNEIIKELSKPANIKKTPTYEAFHKDIKNRGKTLESKYNQKIKKKVRGKPVKTKITIPELSKNKKDNDVDFKISIAPNTALGGSAAPFTGGSEGYPDGMDVTARTIDDLWKDIYPKNTIPNEKDPKKRAQTAKKELKNKHQALGADQLKRLNEILKFFKGERPRKFTSVKKEDAMDSSNHTAKKHVFNAGGLVNSKYDLMMRVLRGKNSKYVNLGVNTSVAGAFKSSGAASEGIKHAIDVILTQDWENKRKKIADGTITNKIEQNVPFSAKGVKILNFDGLNKNPVADLPEYLKHPNPYKIENIPNQAVGARPLFSGDPGKVPFMTNQSLNPLTKDDSASISNVHVRIIFKSSSSNVWSINSAWPE